MKQLEFVFENQEVEIFELEGVVYFNPKDVCKCLGITDANDAIRDFNEKKKVKLTNSIMGNNHFRKLHNTGENFLTESGVYKLIFKSRKEEAEKFQDWVTDEVLPKIRNNGYYVSDDITNEQIEKLQQEVDALKIEKDKLIEQMKQDRISKLYGTCEIIKFVNIKGLQSAMISIFLVRRGLGSRELVEKYHTFKPNKNITDLKLNNYVHQVGNMIKYNKEFADVINEYSDEYYPILESIKKEYNEAINKSKKKKNIPFLKQGNQ